MRRLRSQPFLFALAAVLAAGGIACGTGRLDTPPIPLESAVRAQNPPSDRGDDAESRLESTINEVRESAVALEYSAEGAPKGTRRVASGVVISDVGDVLSVRVNPPPSSSPIMARIASGRVLPARWIAGDPETGLTLLKIKPGSVRPATVSSRGAKLGMSVLVVGNPFGLAHSVARGFVAGLNRRLALGSRQLGGLIQVDAALHPGDSGAIVADLRGDWLGVVRSGLAHPAGRTVDANETAAEPSESPKGKAKRSDKDNEDRRHEYEYDHDLGFAIPACDALWVANQLRDHGRVDRAYLGVTMNLDQAGTVSFSEAGEGAILGRVLANTPADRAGLLPGDRVVALDRYPVRSAFDLTDRLDHTLADSEITVELIRGVGTAREHKTLSLRTAHRPTFAPPAAAARAASPSPNDVGISEPDKAP